MVWWQVALLVVVVAAVVAWIAYVSGRRAGAQETLESATLPTGDADDDPSLFGDDAPVRASEERFILTMPDAVIIADAAGVVQYASNGAKALELIDENRIASDELTDILAQVASDGVLRERELELPVDLVARRANSGRGVRAGEPSPSDTLYLKVRIGRICDDRYAMFLADMSEQRRFEAMRRDFVTNVSHELKTPAGAISLLAETVGDAADDPDAVRYFSQRICKESARLTELVHRLIDLQRAQDAKAIIDAKRLSMLRVARTAISENKVQAESKRIAIRLSVDGRIVPLEAPVSAASEDGAAGEDGPAEGAGTPATDESDIFVMADEESIVTAVKNLVENAIRYSPERTTVRVAVSRESSGNNVVIRVIDQGIGIPRESLGRIFERFYRVDPARSRATGGTGLGLSITKHCIEDCGGTISVWSRPGEGSTFTISLPQAGPEDGSEDRSEDDGKTTYPEANVD